MRASHPPELACWLLKHLVPEGRNEILAGDLLEEFGARGSAWYWRQVLAAIIFGFFHELRVRRTAVLFATVFSIAVPWPYIMGTPQFRSLLYLGIRLPWPLSLISQIGFIALLNVLMLGVATSVYLAVVRNCNPRKLTQAFLAGLSVVVLSSTGIFCAPALHPFRPRFVVPFLVYLPLLFGLFISMWIIAPGVQRTDSTSLSAQNESN
jgi:hypothetical protein